jgi:hypothetical protein
MSNEELANYIVNEATGFSQLFFAGLGTDQVTGILNTMSRTGSFEQAISQGKLQNLRKHQPFRKKRGDA